MPGTGYLVTQQRHTKYIRGHYWNDVNEGGYTVDWGISYFQVSTINPCEGPRSLLVYLRWLSKAMACTVQMTFGKILHRSEYNKFQINPASKKFIRWPRNFIVDPTPPSSKSSFLLCTSTMSPPASPSPSPYTQTMDIPEISPEEAKICLKTIKDAKNKSQNIKRTSKTTTRRLGFEGLALEMELLEKNTPSLHGQWEKTQVGIINEGMPFW